jgi:hypothetical protein
MRLRMLLSLFFASLAFSAAAQTMYELKYHFKTNKGGEDHAAFLLRNADGTASVRVAFFDSTTKTDNVYQMEMEESYASVNGKQDRSILILSGSDAVRIRGNATYQPDHFEFEYNKETKFYEPRSVVSYLPDGTKNTAAINDQTLLNEYQLKSELLLQYFNNDDAVFKYFERRALYFSVPQAPNPDYVPPAPTMNLHLVIVANTNDKSIGGSCVVDKNATYNTFKDVAEFLNLNFLPTVIEGNNFTKANVDKVLAGLKPKEKDIVVFYYSGHGYNKTNAGTLYPNLDLRNKPFQQIGGKYTMNIESVYNTIRSKGARMNLVISDCCNSDPFLGSNIITDGPSTRTSSVGWVYQHCSALFLDQNPLSLLVTAAAKGELSAGNSTKGGIFTFNLRESLEKSFSPFAKQVSWSNLIASARAQTILTAKRTGCLQDDNSLKACIQNPVYRLTK